MNKISRGNQISCEVGDFSYTGLIDFLDEKHSCEKNGMVHSHIHYELQIICDGRCGVETLDGKNSVELKYGDAVLIEPNCKHFTKKIGNFNHMKYVIQIQMNQPKQENTRNGEKNTQLDKKICAENGIMKVDLPNAVWLVEQIYNNVEKTDAAGMLIKNAFFKLLMTQLVVSAGSGDDYYDAQKEEFNVEMCIAYDIEQYIHQNFNNRHLNIQMVSDWLHLGERQINRLLTKQSGMTFTQFLREQRLNQAQRLLRDTDMSIESIANSVGYDTVVGLHAAFRKRFGITPGECRKQKSWIGNWTTN